MDKKPSKPLSGAPCYPPGFTGSPGLLESINVIVVDDEPKIIQYMTVLIKALGHKVIATAENGNTAYDAIMKNPPDLVITDIKMPFLDGFGLSEKVNQVTHIPFILMSSYVEDSLIGRAKESGQVYSYLVKPIQANQLKPAIQIAMAKARKIEALRSDIETRKLVERAKGVLMKSFHLDEENAYKHIQKTARDSKQTIAKIAHNILLAHGVIRG